MAKGQAQSSPAGGGFGQSGQPSWLGMAHNYGQGGPQSGLPQSNGGFGGGGYPQSGLPQQDGSGLPQQSGMPQSGLPQQGGMGGGQIPPWMGHMLPPWMGGQGGGVPQQMQAAAYAPGGSMSGAVPPGGAMPGYPTYQGPPRDQPFTAPGGLLSPQSGMPTGPGMPSPASGLPQQGYQQAQGLMPGRPDPSMMPQQSPYGLQQLQGLLGRYSM